MRYDSQGGPHGVMSRPTEFPASRLVFAGTWKLKLRIADRTRQHFYCIVRSIEDERVDGIGAGDAKMNWNPSRNYDAVRNEQVLLGDHAHRDRAVRFELGSKIVLHELARQVKGQRVDVARASQKTQEWNIDLVIACGGDQAQSQHPEQQPSELSPVHMSLDRDRLYIYRKMVPDAMEPG